MTASERRRRGESFEFWAGPGVPISGDDELGVVVSSCLRRRIRRLVATMRDLDASERAELVRLFEAALRSTFRAGRRSAGHDEYVRLDALLAKAGLPPLR